MRTNVLQEVDRNNLEVGKKYICLPVTPIFEEKLWVVEIYESLGYLCYMHPEDGSDRVALTCGHKFFEMV